MSPSTTASGALRGNVALRVKSLSKAEPRRDTVSMVVCGYFSQSFRTSSTVGLAPRHAFLPCTIFQTVKDPCLFLLVLGLYVLSTRSILLYRSSLQRYPSLRSVVKVAFLHKGVSHGRSPYPAIWYLSPQKPMAGTKSTEARIRLMRMNCSALICEISSTTTKV